MKFLLRSVCLAGLITSACTLAGIDDQTRTIDETDIYIVSQIVAESLSDQEGGLMNSMFDAFEIPSYEGFQKVSESGYASLFGEESYPFDVSDFIYVYNPATGVHATSYRQEHDHDGKQGIIEVDLEYIFYASNGSYLEHPTLENIATLSLDAVRSGNISTPDKTSSFLRKDGFLINGFKDDKITVKLEGQHTGEGEIRGTTPNGEAFERSYSLSFEFLDVQIDKSTIEVFSNVELGASGALGYTVTTSENDVLTTVTGTIQLSGDGTALLKFRDKADIVTLQINEGRSLEEGEYKGRLASVNTSSGFITLTSKQRIRIHSETLIDGNGDYLTLDEAYAALSQGERITAAGTATRVGNSPNYNAVEAGFWNEVSDGNEPSTTEFSGYVQAVNLQRQTFNLQRGFRVRINADTKFSESGDLFSLEQIREAIRSKKNVSVNGTGIDDPQNRRLTLAHHLVVTLREND